MFSVFLEPNNLIQVLILTFGIYLLLSFLRTTRGSGLVRGLGFALIVGLYGMKVVAQTYELTEIEGIIESLLGFVVVIIAIIFQPELRRGIVSLGENPLLGRFLKAHRKEVITEVALAMVSMAKKKQGALIAFERKTTLDAYIDGAVKIDAEVNRLLLDSLFHHGSALHDGAVIIRGDRVVAAASLFPLTENVEISKSTGTRHRAALGLTEETDAVTVAVSEETGLISICKRGKIERRIPRTQLEEILRERIGSDEVTQMAESEAVEDPPWYKRLVTEHVGQKLGALVLALTVFYSAYQANQARRTLEFTLVLQEELGGRPLETARIEVRLPEGFRSAEFQRQCRIEFSGPREQLEFAKRDLHGILTPPPDAVQVAAAELRPLAMEVADVVWSTTPDDSVNVTWSGSPPQLEVGRISEENVSVSASMIGFVFGSGEDNRNRGFELDLEHVEFHPLVVRLRGPHAAIETLRNEASLRLAEPFERIDPERSILGPVIIDPDQRGTATFDLVVAQAYAEQGIELRDSLEVMVGIRPIEKRFGPLGIPITLQSFSPEGTQNRDFEAPDEPAPIWVITRGLLAGEEGSTEQAEDLVAISRFVKDNLRVFVDIDTIPEGSREGRLEYYGLERWKEHLPKVYDRFEAACQDAPSDHLTIQFEDPERAIQLRQASPSEGEVEGGADGGGQL